MIFLLWKGNEKVNLDKSILSHVLDDEFFKEAQPLDVIDYIYAELHSPAYRERYKEFLKSGFPQIPHLNPKNFEKLVLIGSQLRSLNMLEAKTLDQPITRYPVSGDNVVTRKITKSSPG